MWRLTTGRRRLLQHEKGITQVFLRYTHCGVVSKVQCRRKDYTCRCLPVGEIGSIGSCTGSLTSRRGNALECSQRMFLASALPDFSAQEHSANNIDHAQRNDSANRPSNPLTSFALSDPKASRHPRLVTELEKKNFNFERWTHPEMIEMEARVRQIKDSNALPSQAFLASAIRIVLGVETDLQKKSQLKYVQPRTGLTDCVDPYLRRAALLLDDAWCLGKDTTGMWDSVLKYMSEKRKARNECDVDVAAHFSTILSLDLVSGREARNANVTAHAKQDVEKEEGSLSSLDENFRHQTTQRLGTIIKLLCHRPLHTLYHLPPYRPLTRVPGPRNALEGPEAAFKRSKNESEKKPEPVRIEPIEQATRGFQPKQYNALSPEYLPSTLLLTLANFHAKVDRDVVVSVIDHLGYVVIPTKVKLILRILEKTGKSSPRLQGVQMDSDLAHHVVVALAGADHALSGQDADVAVSVAQNWLLRARMQYGFVPEARSFMYLIRRRKELHAAELFSVEEYGTSLQEYLSWQGTGHLLRDTRKLSYYTWGQSVYNLFEAMAVAAKDATKLPGVLYYHKFKFKPSDADGSDSLENAEERKQMQYMEDRGILPAEVYVELIDTLADAELPDCIRLVYLKMLAAGHKPTMHVILSCMRCYIRNSKLTVDGVAYTGLYDRGVLRLYADGLDIMKDKSIRPGITLDQASEFFYHYKFVCRNEKSNGNRIKDLITDMISVGYWPSEVDVNAAVRLLAVRGSYDQLERLFDQLDALKIRRGKDLDRQHWRAVALAFQGPPEAVFRFLLTIKEERELGWPLLSLIPVAHIRAHQIKEAFVTFDELILNYATGCFQKSGNPAFEENKITFPMRNEIDCLLAMIKLVRMPRHVALLIFSIGERLEQWDLSAKNTIELYKSLLVRCERSNMSEACAIIASDLVRRGKFSAADTRRLLAALEGNSQVSVNGIIDIVKSLGQNNTALEAEESTPTFTANLSEEVDAPYLKPRNSAQGRARNWRVVSPRRIKYLNPMTVERYKVEKQEAGYVMQDKMRFLKPFMPASETTEVATPKTQRKFFDFKGFGWS